MGNEIELMNIEELENILNRFEEEQKLGQSCKAKNHKRLTFLSKNISYIKKRLDVLFLEETLQINKNDN